MRRPTDGAARALRSTARGARSLHRRELNPALAALGWDPPRYMGTAFQNAWINKAMWQAIEGWIGLDQYDEGNLIGQRFLDEFGQAFAGRPRAECVALFRIAPSS